MVSNGDAQRDLEIIANGGILLDPVEADQNPELLPRSAYGPGLKFAPPALPLGPNAKVRELTALSEGEWIERGIPGFLRGEFRPGLGGTAAPEDETTRGEG